MPAGDDDHVRAFVNREFGEDLLVLARQDLVRLRKPLAIGKGFAIIHHGRAESGER